MEMPTPEAKQVGLWELQFDIIPFNDQFKKSPTRLKMVDVAEMPEPDERGRRFADGHKVTWEGVVEEGEWSNRTSSCVLNCV